MLHFFRIVSIFVFICKKITLKFAQDTIIIYICMQNMINNYTLKSRNDFTTNDVINICESMWQPLTDGERSLIAENIIMRSYTKNDVIYRIGYEPKYVMFILRGRVKIQRAADDGSMKIIRIFRDDQFFGFRAFFADENYTTTCISMEDTRTVLFPTNVIKSLINNNKTVMRFFFKELAVGLGMSDDRIVSMAQKHLRERLAETLLFLLKSFGTDEEGWINGKISRSDIANLANMTTSNAIRTLSSFRAEGIIELDKKKIRIVSPEKMDFISGKE